MSYKHETSVDSIHEIFPTLLVVQLNTTADIRYTKISLILELWYERCIHVLQKRLGGDIFVIEYIKWWKYLILQVMNINDVLWVTALFMSKGFTAKCDMRTSHIIFVYTNEDFGVWLHKRSRMVVMVELKLPLLGSEKILFHDLNLWFMKFRLLINYNFNDLYHHISKIAYDSKCIIDIIPL